MTCIWNTLKLKKKKIELKSEKKKKKITKPSPRRAQQHITEVENPQILKKKKKKPTQRIRNQTHGHVAGRENQTPIQSIQSKSKTNSNTEVFIKKKKKNPIQSKPKPNPIQRKPNPWLRHLQLARRHRQSLARASFSSLVACPSSQIADRFALVLSAPSLKVFLSLSLSLSLWIWNENYEMKNATESVFIL